MQFRHFGIDAQGQVLVADMAEGAQQLHAALVLYAVSHQTTAFHGVKELGGVKTARRVIPEGQQTASIENGTEGMGRVIHAGQAALYAEPLQPIHITGIAVDVHRQQARHVGMHVQSLLHRLRRQTERIGINIRENGRAALPQQSGKRRHIRERRGEHLFSRKPGQTQSQLQSGRPVHAQAHMRELEKTAQALFQAMDIGLIVGQTASGENIFHTTEILRQGRQRGACDKDVFVFRKRWTRHVIFPHGGSLLHAVSSNYPRWHRLIIRVA